MAKPTGGQADPFDYEFYSEVAEPLDDLKAEVEERLRRLAQDHTDLIGASVAVEQPAANRTRPFIYRARIVAYVRPNDVVAVEEADNAVAALKGALDAVERQVREQREKLRERWKQH